MTQLHITALELSSRFNIRYYITSDGKLIPASYDESVPANTVAYTWYQVRSKQSNKWTIQLVK